MFALHLVMRAKHLHRINVSARGEYGPVLPQPLVHVCAGETGGSANCFDLRWRTASTHAPLEVYAMKLKVETFTLVIRNYKRMLDFISSHSPTHVSDYP